MMHQIISFHVEFKKQDLGDTQLDERACSKEHVGFRDEDFLMKLSWRDHLRHIHDLWPIFWPSNPLRIAQDAGVKVPHSLCTGQNSNYLELFNCFFWNQHLCKTYCKYLMIFDAICSFCFQLFWYVFCWQPCHTTQTFMSSLSSLRKQGKKQRTSSKWPLWTVKNPTEGTPKRVFAWIH